jgi:orotate phosphoribosyltransferase
VNRPPNDRADVLARSVRDTALLHGEFTLRSGAVSDIYFDKYLLESDPRLLRSMVERLVPLVPDDTEVLAGLEMGGIPVVTLLSQLMGLPAVFVRKAAKTYGTCKLAEGCPVDGRRLTVVEDVVTSGGQIVLSTNDLREAGAVVKVAVALIDRQQGGREALAEAGLDLRTAFTRDGLDAA